jgi:hypothetical protein
MLNKIEDQVGEAGQFIDDGVEDLLEARDVSWFAGLLFFSWPVPRERRWYGLPYVAS